MEWVPDDMWFTHLPLEADAGELDYDLAVSTDADAAPAVADAGIPEVQAVPIDGAGDAGIAWWPVTAGVLAAVTVIGGVSLVRLMAAPPMPAVRTTDRDATDPPASGPQP
jgi:hypothetical protein